MAQNELPSVNPKISSSPKRTLVDLIRVPDPTCIDDNSDEPLGLLYLGSVLRQSGYDVRISNFGGHTSESWKPEIKEADIYGIQLYTPTSFHGINIAKFIKEKFPGKPIICGGAHPTAVPDDPRLEVFDTIVMGEGEKSIVGVVNAHINHLPQERIIQGEVIKDLDSIPFPAWDLVNMMSFNRKVDGQRSFSIIGSRGCCYHCAFCDRSLFGNKVRFRSVNNVVEELEEVISTYGVRNFEFMDDMFTVNKRRLKEFVGKTKDLDISYRCNGRTNVDDPEVYKMLKDSGCKLICFGIESGSQKILDLMRKGTTVKQNFHAIQVAQSEGIPATGYFIMGFPGETRETIQQTREFIEQSDISQAQVYTFIPLPGNEVAKNPGRFGITRLSRNWEDYFQVTGTDGHGGKVIDTPWLSGEQLQEEVKDMRAFLKGRVWKGEMQDYYKKKLGYKVCKE